MKLMKHLSCLALLIGLFCISAGSAQAQSDDALDAEDRVVNTDHDRIFKIRPLDMGQVSLAYEKLRAARVSNEFGLSYIYTTYFKSDVFLPEEQPVDGVAIRMSQRHYTSKKRQAPFGFYHGPVFGYSFIVFEENVFGLEELPPSDPNYRYVGRLYQNALDLSYQLGWQFKLGRHFTTELGAAIGARAKYARATGAGELLPDNIIGHAVVEDENSAIFLVPLPKLNFSVGYSF